jgi:thioredoxin 1
MKANFNSIIDSSIPVLVDAFAEWCGPCEVQYPILKEVAADLGDRIKIIKIDVDKNLELASKFQIQGVPTLLIFKDGIIKYKKAGLHTKQQIINVLFNVI